MRLDQNWHNNRGAALTRMNVNKKMNGAWRRKRKKKKLGGVISEFKKNCWMDKKIARCTKQFLSHWDWVMSLPTFFGSNCLGLLSAWGCLSKLGKLGKLGNLVCGRSYFLYSILFIHLSSDYFFPKKYS